MVQVRTRQVGSDLLLPSLLIPKLHFNLQSDGRFSTSDFTQNTEDIPKLIYVRGIPNKDIQHISVDPRHNTINVHIYNITRANEIYQLP